MFISTMDYRWRVQYFPQDLNRLSPFNPLDCFVIHFETFLIRFLCILGFRSIVVLASGLARRILHWQMALLKRLNEGMLILQNDCSTNHCYQSVARILIILHARNCLVTLLESDLSFTKIYERPLGYAEGSPLTSHNHFIQPYRVLDTLFSEYY